MDGSGPFFSIHRAGPRGKESGIEKCGPHFRTKDHRAPGSGVAPLPTSKKNTLTFSHRAGWTTQARARNTNHECFFQVDIVVASSSSRIYLKEMATSSSTSQSASRCTAPVIGSRYACIILYHVAYSNQSSSILCISAREQPSPRASDSNKRLEPSLRAPSPPSSPPPS